MIDGYEFLCNDGGGSASSSLDDLFQILIEYWGSDPLQYPSVAKDFTAFYLLRVLEQSRSFADLLHSKKDQLLGSLNVLAGCVQEKKPNGVVIRKLFAHGTRGRGYRFLSPDYRSAASKIGQEAFSHWFGTSVVDGYSLQERDGSVEHHGTNAKKIGRNQGFLPFDGEGDEDEEEEEEQEEQENEEDKCGLVVSYNKAGIRKSKFCMSKKFLKRAPNLCHRPLWGEEGVVADVCCHSCAMFQNK